MPRIRLTLNGISVQAKSEIERLLRRDVDLHLYEIGDLDDFFWPYTNWYALEELRESPVVLLYSGMPLPNLMALESEATQAMRELISSIIHLLPARFYSHLTPGLRPAFEEHYSMESHGRHLKMALFDKEYSRAIDVTGVERLTKDDYADLMKLYQASYPDHWFDPRMLETEHYFGIREGGQLVSVAGIHVYSKRYRVAVVGNVTTHRDWRGRGFALRTRARLCRELMATVDHIGLNVSAENAAAIRCYERLGFRRVGEYDETLHKKKG